MRKLFEFQKKISSLNNIEKIFYGFVPFLVIIIIFGEIIKYDTSISTFVGGAAAYLFSYKMEIYKEENRKFDKIKNFLLALEICLRNVSVTRATLIDPEFIGNNHVFFPQLVIKNYFDDLLGLIEQQDYNNIMFIKKILMDIDSHIKNLERINNEVLTKYIVEGKNINLSQSSSPYQSFKKNLSDNIIENTESLRVLIKELHPNIEIHLEEKVPNRVLPAIEWEEIIEGLTRQHIKSM